MQAVVRGGAPEPEAVSEISHRGYVAYGIRGGRDKYVQRFSPEEDELYFDLRRDPQEKKSTLTEAKQRAGDLRAKLEGVMSPSPYQNHLKLVGQSAYVLEVRSAGFIENADAAGFGLADKYEVSANKHGVKVTVRPKPGQPRELTLAVRPMGAPIWLSGTRDGKPLQPGDVRIAREGAHPPAVPFKLPEAEPSEHDEVKGAAGGDKAGVKRRVDALDVLSPPAASTEAGVHLWVTLRPGASTMGPMSREQCEEMKALGYVSSCGN
jgi:hypothetical protein